MAEKRFYYEVKINSIPHVLLLSSSDAERYGDAAMAGDGRREHQRPELHVKAQAPAAQQHGALRTQHLVHAADVHVVHQMTVLQVEAVAAGGVAMGDEHAFGTAFGNHHLGFNLVAA